MGVIAPPHATTPVVITGAHRSSRFSQTQTQFSLFLREGSEYFIARWEVLITAAYILRSAAVLWTDATRRPSPSLVVCGDMTGTRCTMCRTDVIGARACGDERPPVYIRQRSLPVGHQSAPTPSSPAAGRCRRCVGRRPSRALRFVSALTDSSRRRVSSTTSH